MKVCLSKTDKSDSIILPFWQKEGKAVPAFKKDYPFEAALADFTGKEEEVLLHYPAKGKRFLLVGLGKKEEESEERMRRSYAAATKLLLQKKIRKTLVVVPNTRHVTGVAEGIFLANYCFDEMKTEKGTLLEEVAFDSGDLSLFEKAHTIAQAVHTTRNLVNGNADVVTPEHLAKFAKGLAGPSVKVKVFDKAWLKKQGMGLLLAVSRSADVDPYLIAVEYRGNPKNSDHTLVVGKGVTYDTGGLNLKPTGSMEDMKCDMAGAAAGLGLIVALKALKLKRNVTVVIPTTENAISAASYKPGDVYTSFLGKTVEVDNTDAEGRLILADALAWGNQEYKPSRIIDLATLTGAVFVTFAEEIIATMGNDEALLKRLQEASERTFERTWSLPLYDEFKELLKSDIADIKNSGDRGASSIKGGIFLKEFVGTTPWAHLDIAGVAFLDKGKRYWPKGATGIGVRLLVDFLENL